MNGGSGDVSVRFGSVRRLWCGEVGSGGWGGVRRGEERSGQVRRLGSGAVGRSKDRQGEAVLVISVRLVRLGG